LDTIYELFSGLVIHAASQNSDYREPARDLLRDLQRRGVVILEIDAGAKPSEHLPRGPLSGQTEPVQGLNNASYTNADRVKELYIKETRRTGADRGRNIQDGSPGNATFLILL
jgi:hypothetical protein